jgi:hypothetical protein
VRQPSYKPCDDDFKQHHGATLGLEAVEHLDELEAATEA